MYGTGHYGGAYPPTGGYYAKSTYVGGPGYMGGAHPMATGYQQGMANGCLQACAACMCLELLCCCCL